MNGEQETVPLHVRSQGEGSPLLILHGLFGSGMNWNRIARSLASSYQVHLVDLRNHGQSPHHPEMTYEAMAEDVLEAMNTLEIQKAAVLGHSMGGKAAMQLALNHGDRITGLIVADMAPVKYEGDEFGKLIASMRHLDLAGIQSRQEASKRLEPEIPNPGVRQFLLTNLVQQDGSWQWRIPLEILEQNLSTIRDWPSTQRQHKGPSLFIHGEKSGQVTDAGEETIRGLFPKARIEALAGCGHWLHAEDPEGFLAIVGDFMKANQL